MVEKGIDRRNSASPGDGDAMSKYKGQARIIRNSGLASQQGFVTPVKSGVKHSHLEHSAKKGGSRCVAESPVLILGSSPSNRQNSHSPKLKGMAFGLGGGVSSSPSSREGSPRTSPTLGGNYAGAKFSEPPSPDTLPKPPPHWTGSFGGFYISSGSVFPILSPDKTDNFREISQQLKVLLKVPA